MTSPSKNKKMSSTGSSVVLRQQRQFNLSFNWRRFWGLLLERYSRAMGSSVHRDRLLKTLQYTLWWYAHLALPHKQAANKLSAELCWARYLTRVVEWPMAWEAVWNDSWTPSWAASDNNMAATAVLSPKATLLSRVGRTLGRCLAWSMAVYYPAEHMAFVHWKLLPPRGQRLAEMYSAWSCRAWLLYILTDLVQGYLALTTTTSADAPTSTTQDRNRPSVDDERQQAARYKHKVLMARNLLFLLPAYHWSLPNWDKKPWLQPTTLNLFMWLEAVVSLYQTTLEVK